MRQMVALLLVTLTSFIAESVQLTIVCTSSADCLNGDTCVAGDSAVPIQTCVAGAVCGGTSSGNCPSDTTSGQLACIQRNSIYQCVSIERCDQYFGGASCSGGCSASGVACSGQGTCNLVSTDANGRPGFSCSCNEGFSGDKCEDVSRTDFDSSTTSRTTSNAMDSSFDAASQDFSLLTSSSQARSTSTTSNVADPGSVANSEVDLPDSVSSRSGSPSESSFVPGSTSAISSDSRSNSSLSSDFKDSLSDSMSSSLNEDNSIVPDVANSGSAAPPTDSKGTTSIVFIIIGVLAACIIVGALLFAMYSRKQKREQNANSDGFGGVIPLGATAARDGEHDDGSGADTPKSNIVTM
ncbi:hypothetical protein CCR75_004625 [Bremia lactucae]|uniref:EGF-like domain-containing protein n=1 Tax=Bremia lactucae TaxID=4779 RepID=A0A976P049_BRELC|nr:hypothetical protein CCR75_004625 [Bremia lactucae]